MSVDDVIEAINRAPDDQWRERVIREAQDYDPRGFQEIGEDHG